MSGADHGGELVVTLRLRRERVEQVQIDSTRPQLAERLFAGRTVDEALALVPRVFSICGRSQAIAAQLATEAARGVMADELTQAQRAQRVEAEMAQEYLWRALVDWSRATDSEPSIDALAALRKALARDDVVVTEAVRPVVERAVLAGDSRAWYEDEHVAAFEIWIARALTPAARLVALVQRDGARHGAPRDADEVPLLPPFEGVAPRLLRALEDEPQFERAPHLSGRPAETGAAARLAAHPLVAALDKAYGRSVLTRLAARITELARLAAGAPAPRPLLGQRSLGPGRGFGWVETARGLLLHWIELAGDAIARYRIVAPTEWNFHPRGALVAGLEGTTVASERELRRRAEWLVQALDPCVAFRLEISHA